MTSSLNILFNKRLAHETNILLTTFSSVTTGLGEIYEDSNMSVLTLTRQLSYKEHFFPQSELKGFLTRGSDNLIIS